MTAADDLLPLLFGDVPMDAWPTGDEPSGEPWDGFVRARRHLADGDQDLAIREWSAIAGFTQGESRQVLQAWHFLRSCNVHPDESIASEVLGVVVQVTVNDGHDTLAAYADGSVRYLNHAGGASVIDVPPPEMGPKVTALLAAGQALASQIGTWDQPSLPPLPVGTARVLMLTRGGHRFGQGPDADLLVQPGAAELFAAATDLLAMIVDL